MSESEKHKNITEFWVAGITYRTTDISTRSTFAVSQEQYSGILEAAGQRGLTELFILSTCNRTEIYGFAPRASDLTSLISPHHPVPGVGSFHDLAYIKNGIEAVRHLFRVSAGLDSQILGDYEIVGQVKAAVGHARKAGFIGTYMDRLINTALQSSKAVRSNTRLSNGTVSVAFAAVQYMKAMYSDLCNKKVLLIGTGKIGRNACKSLVECFPAQNITVINRTEEKAVSLANEYGLFYASFTDLDLCVQKADIILVATHATDPIITRQHLSEPGNKLLIDLSIPSNVAPDVRDMPGITLINVDELSRVKDETLLQREAEVPFAEAIISTHLEELENWYGTHIILHTVKNKLQALHTSYNNSGGGSKDVVEEGFIPGKNVHNIIASLAVKVKGDTTVGCHCIAAFNEFIGNPVL